MSKLEWEEARCPACGLKYSYIKGGYKPSTCNNFDCLYKYLHKSQFKGTVQREGGDAKANGKD